MFMFRKHFLNNIQEMRLGEEEHGNERRRAMVRNQGIVPVMICEIFIGPRSSIKN
jgi:hypothetical protein